ncbi:hypothetical protein PPYR_05486 [Photinus pyralis]|uniref:RING-type E3 ubiquitin transferase n=4 Tax=Photinus pyralis TaxID=7054 RepID=A0A1Y1L5I5_PHOPY|nr:probable E3 ubiquitin-protein ligase makorin-1 isoform X1 [Photinus pyralis]KAB0801132.1 hypothetical protein PPYR_05486 [Photinus pyralis]
MANDPPRYFLTSSGRQGGTNNLQVHDIPEDVLTRGAPRSQCAAPRMVANNRSRVVSATRNRLERIQNRRSDHNIREYCHSSLENPESDRPQDNKENESTQPKPRTSPKPNNLINRNNTRGIQETRPLHIFHSQPSTDTRETAHVNNSSTCPRSNTMSYSLPRGSLSLSPSRVVPSTSVNNYHLPRYHPPNATTNSVTLRRETTQGTSSQGTSQPYVSLPSTSKSTEPSIALRRPKCSNESWINAPEFRPKNKVNTPALSLNGVEFDNNLCFNLIENGICKLQPHCPYTHDGDLCEVCNRRVLHPTDEDQRERHRQVCHHTRGWRENTTAQTAQSKDKICGICFDIVVEKETSDRRFGILNRCNHVFCLSCIRQWRQARNFENKVVKSCPSCRVPSEFVCPSNYWVDTKEEKDKLIKCYKQVLAYKPCKYFKQGAGECPFGNKCFYLHALPDGTKTDVGPPKRRPRQAREDRVIGIELDQMILWDLQDFDPHWLYSLTEEFDDISAFFSDSDDSDGFDFEVIFQRD